MKVKERWDGEAFVEAGSFGVLEEVEIYSSGEFLGVKKAELG